MICCGYSLSSRKSIMLVNSDIYTVRIFYSLDEFMAVLHSNRCTASCEAHANSVDESACLMANNSWNEVITIHRAYEMLKMPSSLHTDIFCNCFVKKHGYNVPSCTYNTPDTNFHWMASAIVLPFLH
jgi:hypothetical protein